MSLRTRVLAGLALIAFVLVAVMVVITRSTRANLIRQVDAQLEGAVTPVRGIDFGPRRDPQRDPARDRLSALYIAVLHDGQVMTLVSPALHGAALPAPVLSPERVVAGARSREPFTVSSAESDMRYRARAYLDRRRGDLIVIALPIDSVDAAVASLIRMELAALAAITVALGLVGWWVIHLGVRPVKQMTRVATAIAAGDMSHRVPDADTRTEAGELGAALNAMLARIEAAFEERARADARLRQFVADASHELRTPVATIRGYAELYRSGGLSGPGALDDAMRRTEQEALRMGSLVDDLLHLARLDQGRPLESDPVDLSEVVRDAAIDARAVDPGREVRVVADSAVIVRGDDARLRQVVANIVGNALVHTPSSAAVELRAFANGSNGVIEVIDEGPGMRPEVRARAFERFYREDAARSRHRGGSGLGLSIVEATVRAHGGSVSIESEEGRGTTVRVTIPLI